MIDVKADTPGLDAMLARFNSEHWHDEDEVRLIVEGRGLFHIHPPDGPVFAIEVEAGDLIRVPRGTHHWFDLCGDRRIRAIRLFQDPSGWTPHYTESGVDRGFQPVCFGPAYFRRAARVNFRLRGSRRPRDPARHRGHDDAIAFVYEVLFPFARARLRRYLAEAQATIATRFARRSRLLRAEWAGDAAGRRAVPAWTTRCPNRRQRYLEWLMDRDVKSPALKRLQGLHLGRRVPDGRAERAGVRRCPAGIRALARGAGDTRHLLVGQRAGAAAAVRRDRDRATSRRSSRPSSTPASARSDGPTAIAGSRPS